MPAWSDVRAIVRQAGEERWVDVDLDAEIRSGRIPGDAHVCYAPWTGDRFVRVDQLADAGPALDAVGARLHARFSRPIRAPLSLCLLSLVLLAGVAQGLFLGGLRVPTAAMLDSFALSWEGTLLGGAWWSVWTAPLLHAGPGHLLVNAAVLGYSGWRVERALGSGGLLLVLAAALIASTLVVLAFGALPVVGASALAYGVWAAQIAVGLRHTDRLPLAERGYYGWGNLLFFLPLWLAGAGAPGVSIAAHLGGLLGGGLVALVAPSAVAAPRARSGRVHRRLLGTGTAALAGLAVAARVASTSPDTLGVPWRSVTVESAGLELRVPARYEARMMPIDGLRAWVPSDAPRSGVFCGLLRGVRADDPADRARAWGAWFHGEGRIVSPRTREASGATRLRLSVGELSIVEEDRRRGRTIERCGYWTTGGEGERFYEEVLDGAHFSEPPALARARARHREAATSPSRAWDYATELTLVGDFAQADALLASLDERDDRWALDAARARVELWGEAPSLAAAVPSLTMSRWIERADAYDLSLIHGSVDTLVARGDCALVQRAITAVRARLDATGWRSVEERLGTCRVARSAAVRL